MSNRTGFKRTTVFSEIMNGTDFCEHVTADDTSKGIGFFYEKDSFGYVCAEIVCQECKDKAQEEIDNSPVYCIDCNQEKPSKEVSQWRWYDFYAPQGDEAKNICNACWNLPTHQQRMAKDDEDYYREHGDEDDDGDY